MVPIINIIGRKIGFVITSTTPPDAVLVGMSARNSSSGPFQRARQALEGSATKTSILLYGPLGAGKTMIAKVVATTSEANFISIEGADLLSKWVGESGKQGKARRAVRRVL
jgi:SpoVK/Ycf46/Vps4 family AAA+-type ATPase